MLALRELSVSQLHDRLRRRGFAEDAITAALTRLDASGALDDRRTALAFARTELRVKHRGRARVLRQLEAIGIARDLARDAVAEVYDEVDEADMIAQALARRRRSTNPVRDPAEFRRLHAYLVRQGFSSDAVIRALKARATDMSDD
jgi:regulatory protein